MLAPVVRLAVGYRIQGTRLALSWLKIRAKQATEGGLNRLERRRAQCLGKRRHPHTGSPPGMTTGEGGDLGRGGNHRRET